MIQQENTHIEIIRHKRVNTNLYLLVFLFIAAIELIRNMTQYYSFNEFFFFFENINGIITDIVLNISFYICIYLLNRKNLIKMNKKKLKPIYSLVDVCVSILFIGTAGAFSVNLIFFLTISESLIVWQTLPLSSFFEGGFTFFLSRSVSILITSINPMLIIIFQIALTGRLKSDNKKKNISNFPPIRIFTYIFFITFVNSVILLFSQPIIDSMLYLPTTNEILGEWDTILRILSPSIPMCGAMILYAILYQLMQNEITYQKKNRIYLNYSLKQTFVALFAASLLGAFSFFIILLVGIPPPAEIISEVIIFFILLIITEIEMSITPILIVIFQLAKKMSFESQIILYNPENI